MKILLMFLLLFQVVIHQTIPGTTIRDVSKPSIVIDEYGTGYRTIPGTMLRDYAQPGIIVRGNDERVIRDQYRFPRKLRRDTFIGTEDGYNFQLVE